MNPDALLGMLEPLREPAPLSWWPPAPGWWVLAFLLLALLTFALRALKRAHARGAPLRAARRHLEAIANSPASDAERISAITQLHRRVAIAIAGRSACAGLTGEDWSDFLNAMAPASAPRFDAVSMQLAYQPEVQAGDVDGLIDSTRHWLQSLEPAR